MGKALATVAGFFAEVTVKLSLAAFPNRTRNSLE